ncbi:MAG: hypothetical protein H6807_00855 [Planctomycetes bacterium]|nr:hypothetical protein [Planctomycetota bacterium]
MTETEVGKGRGRGFALVLLLLSAPVAFAPSLVAKMAALRPVIDPARVYFSDQQPLLLYLVLPLGLLGATTVVLGPGLVLARLLRRGPLAPERLLVDALGWTAVVALVLLLAGGLRDLGFGPRALVLLVLAALGPLLLLWRRLPGPEARLVGVRGFFLWVVLPALLLGAVVAPKIFWEAVNGDGAHAYEATRLLLHGRSPFFPAGAGTISNYPGPNSLLQGFLGAPFLVLLGEDVAGLRWLAILALAGLVSVIRLLLPEDLRRHAGPNILIWVVLLAVFSALGWSAGYDAYAADLALPAAQDLLLVTFFLAAFTAFVRGERRRFLAFAFLTLTCSPGGGLLLLFLPPARLLARGPRPWRESLELLGLVLLAVLAQALLGQVAQRYWGMEKGGEHGLMALLRKLRFVDLGDWRRWLWLVPGGLFPLAIFFRFGRANREARTLALVGLASFLFYYPLLKTNLHYFAPAMILPLAAFLLARRTALGRPGFLGCLALGLAALLLSLPTSTRIGEVARLVGEDLDLGGQDGYDRLDPAAYAAVDLVPLLIPAEHEVGVPAAFLGISPLAIAYHSRRAPVAVDKNLSIRSVIAPVPPDGREIGRDAAFVARVRDPEAWEKMRRRRLPDCRGQAFLLVDRERLFGSHELERAPGVMDLGKLRDILTGASR